MPVPMFFHRVKAKYNWLDKRTKRLKKTVRFSIYKAAEGGLGRYALTMLHEAGIPARQCHSPYMGHIGIEVPAKFERKAAKLVM